MNTAVVIAPEPEPRSNVATTTPADLIRLALERNAPLEQIEKFMDLNDRWEAKQARNAFVQAMAAFKAEPIEILKRKRVFFESAKGATDYNHAELSDVCDAIVPALAKHDLSHRWDVKQADGQIQVTCVLTHIGGHSESLTLSSGADQSGNKNSIQAIGSAATYLSRYTLLLITGLATKAMRDDDGRGSDKRSTPMAAEHQATITARCDAISKTMLKAVLKSYKVEQLEDIPDTEYQRIIDRLDTTERERATKQEAAK